LLNLLVPSLLRILVHAGDIQFVAVGGTRFAAVLKFLHVRYLSVESTLAGYETAAVIGGYRR
jgi:hypothetical protein